MVTGGLLAPIDTSRIDDWDLILPIFKDGKGTVDDEGNVYMVPLQGGAAGLIYNNDMVPEGIDSYDELFFGDWEGTIAVSNEPINTIGDMLLALGYGPDIYEATDEQVTEAVDALIEAKKSGRIRAYFDSDTDLFNLLATEEVAAAAHGFSSLVHRLAEEDVTATYVAPAEGEVSWNCGHGISANAENVDAAYALINWYMTPFVQITFADVEDYLASNRRTLDEGDPEIVERVGLRAPAEEFTGTIYEGDPENREFWQDEWRRFQTS
jgi:spermidine/putrescine transport system substrate-binding protein